MKKLLCLLLALVAVFSLCACGGSGETGETGEDQSEENTPKIDATATEAETAKLEEAYTGLQVHHGQLHDHASTGRTALICS